MKQSRRTALTTARPVLWGALFVFSLASPAQAQSLDVGTISREITKDLPRIAPKDQRRSTVTFGAEEETQKVEQKGRVGQAAPKPKDKIAVWDEARDLPEEQLLAASINKIILETSRAHSEISVYLKQNYAGKTRFGSKDLRDIRSAIWGIYLQQGRLAYVSFRLAAGTKVGGPTALGIRVTEVQVRDVVVMENEGTTLGPDTRAQIKAAVSRAFTEGRILNLERVDAEIKHRMRLGDYDLRVSLDPVSPTHVDVQVFASGKAAPPASFLLQYDNSGIRSFGKDRATAGFSSAGLFEPGDKVEVMALKTLDVGRLDTAGVVFGRVDYDVPVGSYGVRVGTWLSALHYDAIEGTTANSEANGQSYEAGFSLTRPLYTEADLMLDGRVDFLGKIERGKANETTVTSEKTGESLRARLTGQYRPEQDRMIDFGTVVSLGNVDLSGSPSAYAMDKLTAKAHGFYAKLAGNAGWREILNEARTLDLRLQARGQTSFMNLDSGEKFTLGGSSGLRAFGAGEASGDHGVSGSVDLGYALQPWLRGSVFYEAGAIWRNFDPWTSDRIPNNYGLQDAGFGLSGFWGPFEASFTFAGQIGDNQGLSADGKDSDNVKRRYRVWTTLSYRY